MDEIMDEIYLLLSLKWVEASQSKLLRRRHQVIRQQGKTLC
jgi:hypothetical protein